MLTGWVDAQTLLKTGTGAVFGCVLYWLVWQGLEAYKRWRACRKVERTIRILGETKGEGAVALVVSVSRNIEPDVRRFLDADEKTRGMPIFAAHREAKLDHGGDWYQFLQQVKEEHRKVRVAGASRIFLFCNVPVTLAIGIGGLLLPGPEVVVYHYEQDTNTYRPLGTVNFDTIKA